MVGPKGVKATPRGDREVNDSVGSIDRVWYFRFRFLDLKIIILVSHNT